MASKRLATRATCSLKSAFEFKSLRGTLAKAENLVWSLEFLANKLKIAQSFINPNGISILKNLMLREEDLGNDGVALLADVSPSALNVADLIGGKLSQRMDNIFLAPM